LYAAEEEGAGSFGTFLCELRALCGKKSYRKGLGMLASKKIAEDSVFEAIEHYFERGWTDGLPIVPPTEERVQEFLDYAGLAPDTVLGQVEERARVITAEKVAINAVMAGCKPEYMPVVVAAIEALADDAYNLHGSINSTGGAAPLLIVNGPIAKELNINSGVNVFGPGNRANATIGRTIRLIFINVLGTVPGVLDKSTLGHPGKYTYCIAENEEISPWDPLHVERGFSREASTVTVYAAEGPRYVVNGLSNTPEGILNTVARSMKATGPMGWYTVVIGPEHMAYIAKAGWSKKDIREYLYRRATCSVAELKGDGIVAGAVQPGDETNIQSIVPSPESMLVIVAGGGAGASSAIIPPWGGGRNSAPVTKAIKRRVA